ncbi:MAG: hypothetical protein O7F71_13950 [Gammaproteobacteria bacterium]|nr:hypothetical protein [Gammaproteobacteria bacterium]
MLAIQTWIFTVSFAFCATFAFAQEIPANVIPLPGVVEEVVVKGVSRCGSWPIRHQRLRGCEYAELRKEDLSKVLDLRAKLFLTCLSCQGNSCVTNAWPKDRTTEKRFCKRLFWTPSKVSRVMIAGGHSGPLVVSFTFRISTLGKVEDINLVSFEGDLGEQEILSLIEEGAEKTQFEPVIITDVAYEIIDLRSAFILEELWAN